MDWLPDGLPLILALTLIGTAAATSFLTAAFGIGGGVALLTVMALIVPPAVLIPIHGVVQLGSNAGRAAVMAPHLRKDLLLPFATGALLGVALGGTVAVSLPPSVVQVALAVFILYSVWGPKPNLGRVGLWVGGFVSSVLTMFFGATGPFVTGLVKTHSLDRMAHMATFSAFMTLQHGLKVIAFGFLGFAFGPWLPIMLAMVAAGFIGTVVGKKLLLKTADERFHTVLNVLLTLLCLRLLWAGVSDWTS
ncbi:MAG: sulfite exporter TauE/SafE family protein [Rhodospirillum sp.]|nr:sulfite exporter TauE/SafE family protein [Rhodospirillum sp.]MCF8500582.1 sulfite exporter TauE/SafE family protein [Rhodospirillum sp.]